MYHIVICDDNQNFIDFMKKIIIDCNIFDKSEALFYDYLSGNEMIHKLPKQTECDLLILDIHMDGLDGHATAAKFRKFFPKALLVFCSGIYEPSYESFLTAPFRYIKKPQNNADMRDAIKPVLLEMARRNKESVIAGKYYYNTIMLKPEDILYIENAKTRGVIHCNPAYLSESGNEKNTIITTEYKVSDLYERLKPYGFERIRYGILINMKYIMKLGSTGEIQLSNGECLAVSRTYLKYVRETFAEYVSLKYQ